MVTPYARRDFQGAAILTSITGDIAAGATAIGLANAAGWPDGASGPFLIVIDPDTPIEEKIWVTSRSATSLNVAGAGDRGADGTTPAPHQAGAAIYHCHGAIDDDEANYAVTQTVGKITTPGDMLIGSGVSSLARIAPGEPSQVWKMVGALPGWGFLTAESLSEDSITSDHLQNGSVTTAAIADGAITEPKYAEGSVSQRALGSDSVGPDELADNAILTQHIGADQVTEPDLAPNSVTDRQIADRSISPTKIKQSGIMEYYAGATAPVGSLICDGRVIARATYPALFTAIGTTYNTGGEDALDFRIPNARDRFLIGAGGLYALGSKAGAATVQLTEAQIPAHTHAVQAIGDHIHPVAGGYQNLVGELPTSSLFINAGANVEHANVDVTWSGNTAAGGHAHGLNATGGNGAHENLPPYCAVNVIIWT